MSDALASLEPRSVWGHFASIARIPRPSKHEERIAAWVRSLADARGFEVCSDAVGNLVIEVPATPGREHAPVTILQGHLDMVCEKNEDTTHDFMNDPIVPRIEGEWVYATGTTLGADNGLGVAAALAVATDPTVVHGPLQLLFTLDEETGLTGAAGLDASMLEGRVLINMDSEEDGILFVGCAGGSDCHLFLDPRRRAPSAGRQAWKMTVKGLRGGHSGLNIHENRGNALKILTRLLRKTIAAGADVELATMAGGAMHNAIPREAGATLLLDAGGVEHARAAVAEMTATLRGELKNIDEGVEIGFDETSHDGPVLSAADRDRLLRLLMALPHGPLGMSPDIPGLVETSNNLAVVGEEAGRLKVIVSGRSSVGSTMRALLDSIRAIGELAGAEVEAFDGYPGWKPDMSSRSLQVARKVYAGIWGKEPEVTAVHAGLECGLLAEKVAGLDMISFGPQIEGAHSPDERANIPSVERFWRALKGVLAELAG